jgi:FMN reductase (NADPH)
MAIAFESMGYGICYIGGLRNNLRAVDELLGLPEGIYPLFGLCVGVPDQEPGQRPRLPIEAVLFENAYPTEPEMLEKLAGYDDRYEQYLAERGAPPARWSEIMGKKYAVPSRTDLAAYYRSKGARLD